MDDDDPIIVRVGTFFFIMGGGVFILFVVSDLAEKADFDYLFAAVLLMGIGWVFRRGKAPPPSAGRFSMINKSRDDARKRREDKEKAKQDAKKK